MMVNTNIQWSSMSDQAVISSIGEYLKHQRLAQNHTQAKIAEMAGVNRWTINKIENGEAISLTSLIQILRALKLLNLLDIFKIENQPSPLQLAKIERQKRQRASRSGHSQPNKIEW